ncbi:hypothetical protein H7X46_00400 [Pseudonocardia sp. C8]|uniref:hypothetical protein n=1 Tax=Pseudonocardia sp. C8 TaxID=2762759 RepID=UPI001642B70C|nr:hypothetical protein [Pseudonocardia sp. C8]MBC3189529.1 hypothetical protein [Pseudonocardia sp. C8]
MVGDAVGDAVGSVAASAFDAAMQKVWDAGVWVLKGGFTLADDVSRVDANAVMGGQGAGALWPSMLWLSATIALGLFFYQLTAVALRGGRGMFRAFTGPAQFGIAIAVTTGTVATLLTASDELTTMFLRTGLDSTNFAAVLDNPDVSARVGENPDLGDVEDGIRSMLLGLAAVFGIIPAGIGFALQMIFRQAAILVLVATIPICAAGLVADSTASWFWRAARWILAAIVMKPALALVLVIGVNIMGRAQGVAGLLAGTAVLLVALFCPMVVYRLLAFVDPGTGAGMAVRSRGGAREASEPGSDSGTSEAMNIARHTEQAYRMGSGPSGSASTGGGGELGGTTARPAAAGSGNAGAGVGGGAAGAGSGGSAAAGTSGLGMAGGAAGGAAVGGFLATKAAAHAAAGYGSAQMSQSGVGHPGPAPAAGPSSAQIGSSAGGGYASATASSDWSGPPASGGDHGPVESGSPAGDSGGPGVEPPATEAGPPEAGRPEGGTSSAVAAPSTPPDPPRSPQAAASGSPGPDSPDQSSAPPGPGPAAPPSSGPPEPGPPTRPDPRGEEP